MTEVGARIALEVEQPAELALSVAVAAGTPRRAETLDVRADGAPLAVTEVADAHGTRIHLVRAPRGRVTIDYSASVGRAEPGIPDPIDPVRYLRQSRYVPSDVVSEWRVEGDDLLDRIPAWVHDRFTYESGSTGPQDGALDVLATATGVCRDYAHAAIYLFRTAGIPARLVSVYAPRLAPMDFHAVVEAYVGGTWFVVDPTRLAPRSGLVRIATGRDAADTAFVTVLSGAAPLESVEVTATTDDPASDDGLFRLP